MNVKKEKVQVKEEQPRDDQKTGSVDQIKKKYGFSLTSVSLIYKLLLKLHFIEILLICFFADVAGNKCC